MKTTLLIASLFLFIANALAQKSKRPELHPLFANLSSVNLKNHANYVKGMRLGYDSNYYKVYTDGNLFFGFNFSPDGKLQFVSTNSLAPLKLEGANFTEQLVLNEWRQLFYAADYVVLKHHYLSKDKYIVYPKSFFNDYK